MLRLKQEFVNLDLLLYEGFDFSYCITNRKNVDSGNNVQFYSLYGIEGINADKKTFKIHKL